MKHIFITYGDTGYEAAKTKIIQEASNTGEFDEIYAYGREDLSSELLASEVIRVKRGGGLWSWKPDVILSTMERHKKGDAIVYCDAGCSLYPSKEWRIIWKRLETHDIIAQRIYKRTSEWTRREIVDYFSSNCNGWLSSYQYSATIIIIISDFTLQFIREWRNLMIAHPEFVMDVPEDKIPEQLPGFKENRHDQAIYSALLYKYLSIPEVKGKIYTQWEHIEDLDPLFRQAIRATRLRQGERESKKHKMVAIFKRLIKDYCFKPFYYAPLQWWFNR